MPKKGDINRDSEFIANDGVRLHFAKRHYNLAAVKRVAACGTKHPMKHPYYSKFEAIEVIEEPGWLTIRFQRCEAENGK